MQILSFQHLHTISRAVTGLDANENGKTSIAQEYSKISDSHSFYASFQVSQRIKALKLLCCCQNLGIPFLSGAHTQTVIFWKRCLRQLHILWNQIALLTYIHIPTTVFSCLWVLTCSVFFDSFSQRKTFLLKSTLKSVFSHIYNSHCLTIIFGFIQFKITGYQNIKYSNQSALDHWIIKTYICTCYPV